MKRTLALALGGAVLALASTGPAAAQEAEIDAMVRSDGQAYIEARDALREAASDPATRDALKARLATRIEAAAWSAETWREDAVQSIAHAWLASADTMERLYALKGLDPAHYRARRRPGPEVAAEIHRLQASGADTGPALLEIWLKTRDVYPFASGAGTEDGRAERLALLEGVLRNLGRTGHPAAPFVLDAVLADAGADPVLRCDAAVALGETGADLALARLAEVGGDAETPASVRTGCLQGIAGLRTPAALDRLVAAMESADTPALEQAAVASVGLFGASWAWQAEGDDAAAEGAELRSRAAAALVDQLAAPGDFASADHAARALAMIADPAALARIVELLETKSVSEEAALRLEKARAQLQLALQRRKK